MNNNATQSARKRIKRVVKFIPIIPINPTTLNTPFFSSIPGRIARDMNIPDPKLPTN